MSLRGALRILGKDESPVISTLNVLLGGLILVAPGLGLAAAPLGALWGWVDQKNEATSLLHQLFDNGVGKLRGQAGYQRHELLKAAHTTLVATAFFDAVESAIGPAYRSLSVTEDEKRLLATRLPDARTVLDRLYDAQVPMPSATMGFEETVAGPLTAYFTETAENTLSFFRGLRAWSKVRQRRDEDQLRAEIVAEALRRYQGLYVTLAAKVPEFYIWAGLAEAAATRAAVEQHAHDLAELLDQQAGQLVRLEQALRRMSPAEIPAAGSQTGMLSLANRAVMRTPLVPDESLRHAPHVVFPTVEQGYVTPAFRYAVTSPDARPAEEAWWQKLPLEEDFDRFLAAYFATPASMLAPMLLLGHPGSGKSLLTRVLAARLPPEGFTTVRVALRSVDADAPPREQIQQALDELTNGRLRWGDVSDESGVRVRVVLLDGLDELLLASGQHGKVGYLTEIVDFQQREYDLQRPVAVIVTSRTVVADRVRVPAGSTLVQLAEFDDDRIRRWLRVWNETNGSGIFGGTVREVDPAAVVRHADLARQPLLLLMLALYACDPAGADLDALVMARADLYRGLLDNFIRREVGRSLGVNASEASMRQPAQTVQWHLGIAAFAMYNRRDGLRVSEAELAADFTALLTEEQGASDAAAVAELAARTVGQFFFIQASEFNTVSGLRPARTFEFLHATFEEFLVALHTVELIGELARTRRSALRAAVDTRILRALLSYRCLVRPTSVISFAVELFRALPDEDQRACIELLDQLSRQARTRAVFEHGVPYRPQPDDLVRAMAAYTANLLLLRTAMSANALVPLADVAAVGADVPDWWRSTVRLWRAGLSDDEWDGLGAALGVGRETHLVHRAGAGVATTPLGEHL